MPGYKRKWNSGRNYAKQGSRVRRRRRFTRIPHRMPNQAHNVHHFKRVYKHSTSLVLSSAGASSGALNMTFNMLPNYTELTSLFDQYRINKLVYRFVPTFSDGSLTASSGTCIPNLHIVKDYDDSTDPTNTTTLMQYPNYQMWPSHKQRSIKFTPAVLSDFMEGAGTATGPKFKQWINLANTAVEHRGIKYYLEQAPGIQASTFYINIFVYVYFSCKGVR